MQLAPNAENYTPLPAPSNLVSIARWQVDTGRRDAPGGGVNGQAGDRWPGPPFLYQPNNRVDWIPASGAYGLRQNGSPLQNPRQPYRRGAGTLYGSNTLMYPQPLSHGNLGRFYHLYGGAQSGGVATSALQLRLQQALALLQARGGGTGGRGR